MIYQFLDSGCRDTYFLGNSGISLVYDQECCDNPDLVEVRKNVYLVDLDLIRSPGIEGGFKNPGFWDVHGNQPKWWDTWEQNCTPAYLYPEPGKNGVYCVGIEMHAIEPFDS